MKNLTQQSKLGHDVTPNNTLMQRTVAKPVAVSGKGLLLGKDVDMVITPALAGEGIVFERTDIEPSVQIPATIANVTERARRTTLSDGDVTIETVEHLMSALAGTIRRTSRAGGCICCSRKVRAQFGGCGPQGGLEKAPSWDTRDSRTARRLLGRRVGVRHDQRGDWTRTGPSA